MDDFVVSQEVVVPVEPEQPVHYRIGKVTHLRVRGLTMSVKRMSKRFIANEALMNPHDPAWDEVRPKTWGDCERDGWGTEGNPCPFVKCKYNLYLDVDEERGAIKLNFPNLEPHEMRWSCALRVAENGGVTLDDVGAAMNITRERSRQVEGMAMRKLQQAMRRDNVDPSDLVDMDESKR